MTQRAWLCVWLAALSASAQPLATEGLRSPAPAVRSDGSDWPTFLGPRQDSTSAETGIRTDWGATGPPLLWHVALGEGYAGPAIFGERVYVFDRERDSARLRALRARDGSELWRAEYPSTYEDAFGYSGGPRATPVVDAGGERVYVHGVDGRLRCHATDSGELLWERDLTADYGVVTNFFGAASTPLLTGELLVVAVGGSPPGRHDIHAGEVRANGTGLVAFDQLTGAERWRSGDELASYSSPVLRTLRGRERGLWLARDALVVFDPKTGRVDLRWPFRAKKVYSVNAATPVVVGDRVFVTESYELGGALLEVAPGLDRVEVVWRDPPVRNQALAAHWMTPVHRDGFLYGSSGEKSGEAELRCVEWATGKVRWSRPGLSRASALGVDGHLVVLTEYGRLLLVEATPDAYRQLADVTLEADVGGRRRPLLRHPAWNAPVLSRGVLYLRGADRLVALELVPPRADG
jgi:outer membrane protein assembly factor BamB